MNPTEDKPLFMERFLNELVDTNNPICLYCQAPCEVEHSSIYSGEELYLQDKYTCPKCSEWYLLFSRDKFTTLFSHRDKAPICYDFRFTCQNCVFWFNHTQSEGYAIGSRQLHDKVVIYSHYTNVPVFHIGDMDRIKLYQKFRTYLLFS